MIFQTIFTSTQYGGSQGFTFLVTDLSSVKVQFNLSLERLLLTPMLPVNSLGFFFLFLILTSLR